MNVYQTSALRLWLSYAVGNLARGWYNRARLQLSECEGAYGRETGGICVRSP